MGKLSPDGKLHYDPVTNEVLEPENWQMEYAPELKIATEIQRQIRGTTVKRRSANIGVYTNEKE